MSEVVAGVIKELRARRAELQPLVAEYREVESALSALEQTNALAKKSRGRSAGRPRQARSARRGRPRKGQPTRSDEFLALVREQPGISIRQAAERMSVQPTSLYRVSSKLQEDGTIVMDGERGFRAQ